MTTSRDGPLPDPLHLRAAGVCLICGEEQLETFELATTSAGGFRIAVTCYLECGCGRRVVTPESR